MEMTREYLTRSAHEVRDAFLKTQEDPTASVVNIARSDDLNGEQVRRLCEAANVAIKRYLTFELKDPQATFPVVDWRNVMEQLGLPQTSFGYVDPDDDSAMKAAGIDVVGDVLKAAYEGNVIQKHASHRAATATREERLKRLGMLKEAREQLRKKECELGEAADKAVRSIWTQLRDDAIKTGSINEAYTIALDRVGLPYKLSPAVDDLFSRMHKSISSNVTSKLAALDVTPVIGAINPDWKLLGDLTTYIASNKARTKVAEMITSADAKIDETLSELFGS